MEKLFYEDQYIKEFTSEIIDIIEKDNTFHVVLDRTAFFPGGGGQDCDLGKIDNHNVIDVYEENSIIYHVVEKKPIKIHKVKCSIDWDRRQDSMHQHLGQHLLSGCFYNLFNANTFGIHLGSSISTVDIEGLLTDEQIREAELLANKLIKDNLSVELSEPNKKELKKLRLRRALPNTDTSIRVVNIVDHDVNACCGVHPNNTMELRMIKIIKFEKHKTGTRIEFLVGARAIEDSLRKDQFSRIICKALNSNETEALNGIQNLNSDLKIAVDDNKKLRQRLADYELRELLGDAPKINGVTVIMNTYENDNPKNVTKLANKFTETDNVVSLLAAVNDNKVNLIFACSKNLKKLSMDSLLKDCISLLDGRGGGSALIAQGAGTNVGNLKNTFDYAFNKLNSLL